MPLFSGNRPLKRWTYAGIFGPDLMLCACAARVGAIPQSFWAVWDRRVGVLDTETLLLRPGRVAVTDKSVVVRSGPIRLELALTPVGEPIEVVSPHGRSYIWTRKIPVRADGHLTVGMEARPVSGLGILDQSAGYHARLTEWEWSAGVGTTVDGWPAVWNLVRGMHDSDTLSERTVWVNGRAAEVPPVRFSSDLDRGVGGRRHAPALRQRSGPGPAGTVGPGQQRLRPALRPLPGPAARWCRAVRARPGLRGDGASPRPLVTPM